MLQTKFTANVVNQKCQDKILGNHVG